VAVNDEVGKCSAVGGVEGSGSGREFEKQNINAAHDGALPFSKAATT
jgi:hypothetical protein